ncbi:ABC transporter ATP-binding protein [Rhizobium sp. S153]|uniref:ABC transporter ATP-binding protein n=1 Tax=Ciceribacter sichuanensis TaxID=2949647 RepID=A0ABT0VEL1_9HYPH|nr:ABC transporter ATP-binding protein [Ciceribacter sp. S153]MCM2403897.1 ABC transporter ATP-binding protein [Ciceribacter sp. S153]
MSNVLCTIRQLSITYGKDATQPAALRDVSLDLIEGERLAIIGESGSGKSTLARAIAGLLPEGTSVRGKIDWPSRSELPRPGRDIGFVFQDPTASLNPVLPIGEQIAEGARRHLGIGWKEAYEIALDLLHRVRIPHPEKALKAYPHQFSGGQRQRIAIAAAISARPSFLIADEATSALDMVVQAEIVSLLDELVRENGMTMLFITHDLALASGFADRVAIFKGGHLVEQGPIRTVLAAPQTAYARSLIANHLDLSSPPLVGRDTPQ